MEWKLDESDIEWVLDASPTHDSKVIFEEEKALAHLLINGVVFLNSFWYEEEWPEKAKKSINIIVNCNDVFAWGSADGEELPHKEIENLYRMWRKEPVWGPAIWCMIQRREMPQKPVENRIRDAGIWDLDSLNLNENTTDAEIQSWMRAIVYHRQRPYGLDQEDREDTAI